MQELRTDELTGDARDRRARRAHRGPTCSASGAEPRAGDASPIVPVLRRPRGDDAARGRARRRRARPTRRAGRCASCRTCTRSSATASPARTKSSCSPPRTTPARRALARRRRPRRARTLRDRAAFHLDGGLRARAGVREPRPARRARRSSTRTRSSSRSRSLPPHVDALLDPLRDAGRDLVADAIDDARGSPCLVRDGAAVSWCPPASHVAVRRADRAAVGGAPLRPSDRRRGARAHRRAAATRSRACTRMLGELAYNIVVNTAPRDDPRPFHWWVDIVPAARRDRRLRARAPASGQHRRARRPRPTMLREPR